MVDKALSFEISSDFAFFRRGYTTTSALTYSVPPKTAVSGLIAAILGRKWTNYHIPLSTSFISIRILSPIRKIVIKENLLETKEGQKGRIQVPFEYLRYPKYKVYFYKEGEPYSELKTLLERHNTHFTPYLGIAKCIADIKYTGEVQVNDIKSSYSEVYISSVIPLDKVPESQIVLEKGKRYARERTSSSMDEHRIVTKFTDILYELSGDKIKTKGRNYSIVKSEEKTDNVIFF